MHVASHGPGLAFRAACSKKGSKTKKDPEKSPTGNLGIWRGFWSKGGLEFGVEFWDRGKRVKNNAIPGKVAPFLGSKFAPLSEFFRALATKRC